MTTKHKLEKFAHSDSIAENKMTTKHDCKKCQERSKWYQEKCRCEK